MAAPLPRSVDARDPLGGGGGAGEVAARGESAAVSQWTSHGRSAAATRAAPAHDRGGSAPAGKASASACVAVADLAPVDPCPCAQPLELQTTTSAWIRSENAGAGSGKRKPVAPPQRRKPVQRQRVHVDGREAGKRPTRLVQRRGQRSAPDQSAMSFRIDAHHLRSRYAPRSLPGDFAKRRVL